MESFAQGEGANGIVLATGSCPANCVDMSNAAFDNTTGDIPITDKMLIGYWEPFDEVNFDFTGGTLAAGSTVTWEYWSSKGAAGSPGWKTLPSLYLQQPSGCSNLASATNNICKVRFTPPADWTRSVKSGPYRKWWVRISVSGGVKPILSLVT